MTGRLASHVLVGGLLRQAEAEGGFGAVVAKGDSMGGSIGVILAEKGRKACFLERMLQPDGRYEWCQSGPAVANAEQFELFLAKRRRIDPDLWIVELDIASAERFAAEMNAVG